MKKCIFCFLFFLPLVFCYGQQTTLASFKLPDANSSGPVDINFTFTYTLSVKTLGSTKELWLKMKTSCSPGTSGGFYKYRYRGRDYTHTEVGMNGFNGIGMRNASFYLSVSGPGLTQSNILFETFLGEKKLGNVPKDAEAGSYIFTIVSLRTISFTNTSEMESSIAAYVNNSKKQNAAAQNQQRNGDGAKNSHSGGPAQGIASSTSAAGTDRPSSSAGSNRSQSSGAASNKGSSSPRSDDSFWSDGKSSAGSTTSKGGVDRSSMPKYAQSKETGEYYEKDANNNYRKVSREAFEAGRRSEAGAKGQSNANPRKSNEEIMADFQQGLQKSTDDFFNAQAERQQKSQVQQANMARSFYAARAVSDAKENLDGLTKLGTSYESIEQLEADFNRKYAAINREVNNLTAAKNQQLQANYETLWSGSSQKDQAIGQLGVAVGSLINDIKADKEKKQAKEALMRQKEEHSKKIEAQEREMAEKKKKALLEMRHLLLQQFPDGGTPLSSHRVNSDEVYFFVYSLDKNTLEQASPVAYMSNVFPVAKYGDGTWPFKTSLVSVIKTKTGAEGTVTLMGYYTTRQLAEETSSAFQRLAEKCGISIKNVTYKGKPSTGGSSSRDFWGNDPRQQPKTPQKPEPKTGDDFWEAGGQSPTKKPAKPAGANTDDFWETGRKDPKSTNGTSPKNNKKPAGKEGDYWNN